MKPRVCSDPRCRSSLAGVLCALLLASASPHESGIVRKFSEVAPKAPCIVVFRVLGLRLTPVRESGVIVERVEGEIQTLLRLRGAACEFQSVRYSNDTDGGHHLEPGRYYLVAAESSPPSLDLRSNAETIGDLFPYDETAGSRKVESSDIVRRAQQAIAGTRSYSTVLDDASVWRAMQHPPPIGIPDPALKPDRAGATANERNH